MSVKKNTGALLVRDKPKYLNQNDDPIFIIVFTIRKISVDLYRYLIHDLLH